MNVKKTDHIIVKPWNHCCWENLHRKEQNNFLTNVGFSWFSKAAVFTPLDPFGNDPEEEEPHDDYTVPQKVPHVTRWIYNQDAVHRDNFTREQDQRLQFCQTKSFSIITYATVPGDCIYRVISQSGDRVLLENLATPRPAPKVTLRVIGLHRSISTRSRQLSRKA